MTVETMEQRAPYPALLARLVETCTYRPGWSVTLEDRKRDDDHGRGEAGGLTLVILTKGYNSYHPDQGENYRVYHYAIVPAATYDEQSWRRWLFEQFLRVEQHEAMEFFQIDGARPFAPVHAPGADPYVVHEYATDEQRRTSFRGEVS